MSSFISYLKDGISLGSIYAIIALGYTMVYGIAKMLNFAHGDVIMVGSYVVYVAVSGMGLNPILAILLSIIICTLMGVVIEGVAYRPLRNAASPLAVLITAIGVSYLLQNVALLIWGADTKSFSNVISLPSLKLAGGSIVITGVTIITIIGGILIMAGLMLFISKTKTGQAMLAVSEDKGAAQLMGINVNKYKVLAFILSGAFLGVMAILTISYGSSMVAVTGMASMSRNFVPTMGCFFGLAFKKYGMPLPAIIIGEFVINIIFFGFIALGAPTAIQDVITGLALLIIITVTTKATKGEIVK